MKQDYPVVVIGAGPVGLAAAAHLIEREQKVQVLESGTTAGASMRSWGHIKMFSTWRYNIDEAARRLLETPIDDYAADWEAPRATKLPTGEEMVTQYVEPLSHHPSLASIIRYEHKVTQVTRVGSEGQSVDKTRSEGRDAALFLVRAETDSGPVDVLARAVIDASGTWHTPNPIGRSGIPAIGEETAHSAGFITSPLPDPFGADKALFAGKKVLVVGAGHSAANTLMSLARLRKEYPETEILWGLRATANPARLYGGGVADELPARGQLGIALRRLVENGDITILENISVSSLETGDRLKVTIADGRELVVDRLVPATGFRPDLNMHSELRLGVDQVVEAPEALGPLIDPALHSCGTVKAHGEKVLSHPDQHLYIVGMKSYGRAPTFLMATGYEQVRSIVAALSGDQNAADTVKLELPETGVCSAGQMRSPAPPLEI